MRTIRTREHKQSTHEDLELSPSDMNLVETLKDSTTLAIREARRGIEIHSYSHIGMARFAGFEVVVDPKIPLERQNLPRLIAYAFGFDEIKMQRAEAGFMPDDLYLIDILVGFFARGCRLLMAQGLLKSYVAQQDDVLFLRGRLLLRHQIDHIVKKRPVFACEFDELEYDNLENQILLYCLELCSRITQSHNLKKDTRILARQLSAVVRHSEISLDELDNIQYTRLNQHYRTLHSLARLIISSAGIGDFSGSNTVSSCNTPTF